MPRWRQHSPRSSLRARLWEHGDRILLPLPCTLQNPAVPLHDLGHLGVAFLTASHQPGSSGLTVTLE